MNKPVYSVVLLFLLSLLTINKYLFFNVPKCHWSGASDYKFLLVGDPQIEGDAKINREPYTGALDLWVNSKYLGFIYGRAIERLQPTYSVILGDLFSSQWIDDVEFEKRVERFQKMFPESDKYKTIYLPGNHDIGYGSDMTRRRVDRFARAFGEVNYWFFLYDKEGVEHHRVVILNSMNLDSTADKDLRRETWTFLKSVIDEQEKNPIPLILLTHVPLHKEVQWCVDKPMTRTDGFGYIVEQNMLSIEASTYILTQLKPRIIVTGHDHHGCATIHIVDSLPSDSETKENPLETEIVATQSQETEFTQKSDEKCANADRSIGRVFKDFCDIDEQTYVDHEQQLEDDGVPDFSIASGFTFVALPYSRSEYLENIERNATLEFTIRSIMGDYGGNLGLLEIFETSTGAWDYHFSDCPYYDHLIFRVVWIVNLLTIVIVISVGLYIGLRMFSKTKKIKNQ
ncbi:Metallo-dependent phosphatase [Basidiobolus meristosporus CBS 931.73]|uniref:Metallo-dependent phosphatase n=1 Tax=Basidiobolus meristosporus CBS 931.73 TaxID=1314790 RepID=A0A1Y1Y0G5_9FUNG|nr:Metallo-dependent phosphatase [Basidiobolus meristosporus CBS 931.73]|eukprot:ORX91385.1 Metallo-dependent phosphatase [Basidiobolus meristosporus CBS 931.73]